MEDLHRNLGLSVVLCAEFRIFNLEVLLDVLAGEVAFVVLASTVDARDHPVADGEGERRKEEEKDEGGAEGEVRHEAREEEGHDRDERDEDVVAEGPAALRWEGRVSDGRIIRDGNAGVEARFAPAWLWSALRNARDGATHMATERNAVRGRKRNRPKIQGSRLRASTALSSRGQAA